MNRNFGPTEQELLNRLSQENFELRRLRKEHDTFEGKLKKLDGMKYLSPTQELERKDLQKKKLNGKDRMQQILKAHLGHNVYV